jgi:THO complex subunit 3
MAALHLRAWLSRRLQVHSVAWNCTGRKLASGSVDRTARIWDIRGVRCRARVT